MARLSLLLLLVATAATSALGSAVPLFTSQSESTNIHVCPSTVESPLVVARSVLAERHGGRMPPHRRHRDDDDDDERGSMLDILRRDHRFTKLVEAVSKVGGNLRDDLDSPQKKTLFAPTNDAFRTLMESGMMLDPKHGHGHGNMDDLLRYHMVLDEEWTHSDLCDGAILETALDNDKHLGGDRAQVIRVAKFEGRVVLNMYAMVIESDIKAENGVIHAIADVLVLPASAFTTLTLIPTELSIQAMALQLTGLDAKVAEHKGLTALIPTNSAWKAMGYLELMRLFHPHRREMLKKFLMKHYVSEVAYAAEIAMEGRNNHHNKHRMVSGDNMCRMNHEMLHGKKEKKLKTWSGDEITMHIECHRGRLRVHIDDVLVSIQDLPAENGAMHLLSAPLRMDDDDEDDATLSSDVVRRTWTKDSVAAASAAASKAASASSTPADAPKLLQARSARVAFESAVGKSQLVQSGAGSQAQAGFYCSVCDRLCKDNVAYLDHLNSPIHLKNTGHKLEIKRATLADVRARIAMHKRRRAVATEEYDMEKRVQLAKAQYEAEKLARKEKKRAAKRKRQETGPASTRRRDEDDDHPLVGALAVSDDEGEESGSEYSDYDIDEHGNIIEVAPEAKKKIKRTVAAAPTPPPPAEEVKDEELTAEQIAAMMGFGAFGSTN
ncbi:hypothetical protein H9P43_007623 [Blastocladiella emersonii ATCC 22665]|nr:hypothetical protein H9P43_007623 [Blastocladiella emersonii ATCC 22665]